MNKATPEPLPKGISKLSEEQFINSDTESLLKITGLIPAVPRAPTAAELIELNRSRVLDCLRLGITKEQTANLIAADPRNTKPLSPRTILRDLARAIGDWKELKRRQHDLSPKSVIGDGNAASGSPESGSRPQSSKQAFIDHNYSEGDVL